MDIKITREQFAYNAIKEKILNGIYPVGMHLVEQKLSEDIGVSRTPIRRAIMKLSSEQFVIFHNRHGAVVNAHTISARDYIEMLEIRHCFLRLSIEKAKQKKLAFNIKELREILAQQRLAIQQDNVVGYYESLWRAYTVLLYPVKNQHMLKILNDLKEKFMAQCITEIYQEQKEALELILQTREKIVEYLADFQYDEALKLIEDIRWNITRSLIF
ncbi:GntR family transcriptional regulator [Bacillus cereus group sp. BfR-BA-01349]|uniref:GntR family transcriptional regulator n=1 Tax=Bacillus cereus group sp. BfR-BA-01349 TaxID=2920312 RepID=UPI001F59A3A6